MTDVAPTPTGLRTEFVPLASHASWAVVSTILNLKFSSQDEVNQMSFMGCFGENEVVRSRHSPDIYPSAELLLMSQGSFKAVGRQNEGEQKGREGA